ncbi:MAG: thiamine pyrophosphate-dependent enzyme [Vicinamibacterales bacterium]
MRTDTRSPKTDDRDVPDELALELYRMMLRVFYVEERMKVFVRQGKCTFCASTRGHELLQTAAGRLLQPGRDWCFPYYRSKALAIALGFPLRDLFLGMLSRAGDPSSNGRNMPEQFSSRTLRLVAQTACTGTQYLPAVGAARAVARDEPGAVVYVASGDGATSEGEFSEALNWAARERLPVLFVIENNGYAISVPQSTQTRSTLQAIAEGFGVFACTLDGTRLDSIHAVLPDVVDRVRRGAGPALVDAHVVRLDPHSSSDDQRKYRSPDELRAVAARDPLAATERLLLDRALLDAAGIDALRGRIKADVDQAADAADASPAPSLDDVGAHVRADDVVGRGGDVSPGSVSDAPVTMIDAINHGLREELERNPRIVMWGEDIADPKGGVFGVTRGLSDRFPDQVGNAPLAEASIVGVAGGMAIAGYKPIVEIQFADYLWPGFMQLRDEIATVRWRSQGAWSCPVVVRIAVGGYIKGGPWHSACVEGFFAHVPGWIIAFPSSADDAKGLLKAAARSLDPVVFLEHKGLYRRPQAKAPEPDADYVVPFGRGRIRRVGTDVTVIAWGSTVHLALEVARRLGPDGPSLEIVDLRTIAPLDEDMIYASVRKTSRVVIAQEDTLTMGFGAEVAARVAQHCFSFLDAPVVRVAATDSFIPAAANLELAVLPSADGLEAAVRDAMAY